MKTRFLVVLAAAVFFSLSNAGAKEIFVDQKSPAADDKGPGTEAAPFKTIQPGVDAAKPGDTVYIKAGTYSDKVSILRKSGTLEAPITIRAWKDDRVRIGCDPRPLPPADAWKPIPGSKSYSTVLPEPVPDDILVLTDDKPVVTQLKDVPPKDDQIVWATYRKSDRTLMFNANGKNPAEVGTLTYARRVGLVSLVLADHWVIRGIEFAWINDGLFFENSTNCVVQDCYFHHLARPGIHMNSRTNIIRRCNFYRCGTAVNGFGPANILEENVIVDCGMNWDEDIAAREAGFQEGAGPTIFKGNGLGQVFRYNTVVEGHGGSGWYADIDAKGWRVIGNAFWDNGTAIYNELAVDDTLITGNYFYHGNVTSSACSRLSILDNYFEDSSVVWHNRDIWPARKSFMTLRGNAFVNPGNGYLSTYSAGWGRSSYPENFTNSMVDFNRIRAKDGSVLINDGGAGKQYKTLDDIRKTFGWEIHGEVKPYDPAKNDLTPEAMGGSTVTYRVPWGKRSYLARPMLSNADIECNWPAASETISTGVVAPASFWQIADGNNDPSGVTESQAMTPYYSRHMPSSMAGYDLGESKGCRWYVDAERKYPDELTKNAATAKTGSFHQEYITSYSNGNHWLAMEGRDPEKIPPQGVGYWSPLLATVEGAKITVSMKIRAKDVVSTDKGSPAVWLEFTNETGQHRQRAFLVGKDEQGKMHHEEFTKGSCDWKEIKETVTAPKDAIRMALFFGVLPCKGQMAFDDINIKTASEAGSVAREILGSRLPLAKIRETFIVDLSKVANRALLDETDNDGKGGWTDQGPNSDMRELATGKRPFGGVPFTILPAPGSVVVLKSSNRAPADLPEKVTIPVDKKFDTIFLLHSAAWVGGSEYFRYVIHYADGKDVTLSVNQTNLPDWIADPVARFPNEVGTFSTVAQTVKVPQFGQGSVYRMEWSAPLDRRAVEIKSIEFIGNGSTVPVLLGITGVTEW